MGRASRWKRQRAEGARRPQSNRPWEFIRPADAKHFYKYCAIRQWDWVEETLLRHRLYFARPSELDDDKDARPKLIGRSREAVMDLLRSSFRRHHSARGRGWVEGEIATMNFIMSPESMEQLLTRLQRQFHKEIDGNRIFSMSLRPDIEDLWSRYGADHAGYCLEFRNAGLFQNAFMVQYGDEQPFDVTDEHAATAHHFYRKAITPIDWSVQQEVRIVTFPRGAAELQPFDPHLLSRIILGKAMLPEVKARILQIVAKRIPAVQVVNEGD